MKARILIVDDEELMLLIWEDMIKSAGYEVETAASGEEALKIAGRKKFDIVITDLIMPGINGVEVCRKIKSIQPEAEVALISGHPEEIKNCRKEFIDSGGMDIFFIKPLSLNEMEAAVEAVMKKKEKKGSGLES